MVKKPPMHGMADIRGTILIPGPERSPGVGNGYPLQYSSLENSMDREAWWGPGGCKKLDTTELLSAHTYTFQLEFLLV